MANETAKVVESLLILRQKFLRNKSTERRRGIENSLQRQREDFKRNNPGKPIPFDLFHNPEDGSSWY